MTEKKNEEIGKAETDEVEKSKAAESMDEQDGERRQDGRMTAAEARAVLEQEKQARVARCKRSVDAILRAHNCGMTAWFELRAGQVIPHIEVVPKDAQSPPPPAEPPPEATEPEEAEPPAARKKRR